MIVFVVYLHINFSHLYQFEKLGDDNNEIEFSSVDFPVLDLNEGYEPSYFRPRSLENLLLVDDLNSMNPLMDSKVVNIFIIFLYLKKMLIFLRY